MIEIVPPSAVATNAATPPSPSREAGAGPTRAATARPGPANGSVAAGTGITVSLDGVARDRASITAALRERLDQVFSVFNRDPGSRGATVDRAVTSLEPIIEQARAGDVTAFQIRLGSLESRLTGGGEFAQVGALREFILDVGLIRFGRVAPADVSVITLTGGRVSLSADEIEAGLVSSQFARVVAVPPEGGAPAALTEARAALDRVRQTRDAVDAFRTALREQPDQLRDLVGARANTLSAFVDIFA